LKEQYAQHPEYKVAYDQLLSGPENAATAGPVLGAYGSTTDGMRGAIVNALTGMLQGKQTPEQAVASAASQANAAIQDYNDRIG
jgi:ABC-type glycerol-3-phosphate transport system substrate-binding protein